MNHADKPSNVGVATRAYASGVRRQHRNSIRRRAAAGRSTP